VVKCQSIVVATAVRRFTQAVTARSSATRSGMRRRRRDHMHEVVEHQQETLVADDGLQSLDQRPVACFANDERLDDGGSQQRGTANRGERNDCDAIGEVIRHLGYRTQREAGLAHATGTGQRQQRDRVIEQEGPRRCDLVLAADKASAGDRKQRS
jgi:hypothetical protein